MIVKVSCHWDQVLWKKKNPGASSLSVFFVCLFFGEMSELQVSKLWCVVQVRDIYRCRSRELKLIYTDSKKQLTVPLACDQPQLWLLPHDISMQWRISLFFSSCQRQANTLSSSEVWGGRMCNSGVIWIPHLCGGVSQPQKSFALMLTHTASLRDLSIKLQHAMQKN